jgi:hypothetical protein
MSRLYVDPWGSQRGECAFEPDATPVLCADCEKPTGLMGTCTDIDFCATCKEGFIESAMYDSGVTRDEAGRRYSAMLIGLIEGRSYKAKYARRRRVLHFSVDDHPVCGARGGPHPMTTNRDESNCKRCLAKLSTAKR